VNVSAYLLRFSQEAADTIRAIRRSSPVYWPSIEHHLRMLASAPTALSQPSMPPFDLDLQMYRFSVMAATECIVLFSYSADEQSLLIHRVVLWHP
jgi:hypothetical protein